MGYFARRKPLFELLIAFLVLPVVLDQFRTDFDFSLLVVDIFPPAPMEDVEDDHDQNAEYIDQQSHDEETILLPIHIIYRIILESYRKRV